MSRVSRSEVIDRAWRALGSGVEPLSGPGGGPLSRTVKLVLIPLLIRPTVNRDLAGAVLDQSAADRLTDLIGESADTLRAAAEWFGLLREFADNPSHISPNEISRDGLYPRAWEMAVALGAPPTESAAQERQVRTVLAELLDGARTPGSDVSTLLADSDLREQLQQRVDAAWRATTASAPRLTGSRGSQQAAAAHTFLDTATPGRRRQPGDGTEQWQQWRRLLDGGYGTSTGRAVATNTWPERGPGQGRRLGLTSRAAPTAPSVQAPEPTEMAAPPQSRGSAEWPWDRSVAQRVRGLLRYSRDQEVLPSPTEMLLAEADRAGAPWQVGSEPARLLLALGTHLALGMHSSDEAGQRTPLPSDSATHERLREMRRRESWLAWATRHPDEANEAALDPVAPYLRRLWVRVHGAETHQSLPESATDVLSLLIGVYRSVLMDGRSRVRADLARRQVGI